jgi:uncharacterized protein YgiM (DUF1202 family)
LSVMLLISSPSSFASPIPTPTLQVTPISDVTYYARSNANLRPCPQTSAACAPEDSVSAGEAVTVTGSVKGQSVNGNTTWYQVEYNSQTLYAHSSVLSATRPAARPAASSNTTSSSNSSSTTSSGSTSGGSAPVSPAVGVGCNGARTCSQMTSCEQARACLAEGNGRLDGDGDGTPCESLCG